MLVLRSGKRVATSVVPEISFSWRATSTPSFVRVTTTYLGLHAIPPEYTARRADYVAEMSGPTLAAVSAGLGFVHVLVFVLTRLLIVVPPV